MKGRRKRAEGERNFFLGFPLVRRPFLVKNDTINLVIFYWNPCCVMIVLLKAKGLLG
jgi:hypothetical protein